MMTMMMVPVVETLAYSQYRPQSNSNPIGK